MRDLRLLDQYRMTGPQVVAWFGDNGDRGNGIFQVPSPIDGQPMVIIASVEEGWDHVSISRKNRSPNQTELDRVYRMFFRDDETAVQYFVPRAEHVNFHPFCLHLWRDQAADVRKPPPRFVA